MEISTQMGESPGRTSTQAKGAEPEGQALAGAAAGQQEGHVSGLAARVSRLSNVTLTLAVASLLFALSAWPLTLVELPPLQDLPNHLAAAHIAAHLDIYPEYVSNGLFKSNSLLTLWLWLLGGHGLLGAARAFTAVVIALNALALPIFVLRFAGRRHLLVAMLFAWPLVHGFFLSMGMLNFACAFALSLLLLVVLESQRRRPSVARGVGIALLSGVLWYAHPFPLLVVGGLLALDIAFRPSWRERGGAAVALLSPLVPVGTLVVFTALHHLVKADGAPSSASSAFAFLTPWEILWHFWLDVSGALTRWGSMSVVPALLLLYFAWKGRRAARPLFSNLALALLAATYVGLPLMMSNWWYLNCRLVPFLWAGLLLRLPASLSKSVAALLVFCALSFSAVLGLDYARLDRDRAEFTAGIAAVPEGTTLLPLLFKHRKTSDFTASLTHAWAYYVLAKNTSAPLVFAVEQSYAITYRSYPPAALIPPALDRFAELGGTPANVCKTYPGADRHDDVDCTAAWRQQWSAFWRKAEPRFAHLLTWAMPEQARSLLPKSYHRTFVDGELEIYAREGAPRADSSSPSPR